MVEMAVADDDVLNLLRIQTSFLHSWYEDLFAFFRCVQGVDDNDSLARRERPRADSVEADVVEIVKNSCRLERLARNRRKPRFLAKHGGPLRAAGRAPVCGFLEKIRLLDRHSPRNTPLDPLPF